MQNPFAGMNPYLEQRELWQQVDHRLIVATLLGRSFANADHLTPEIAPKYRVAIEERIYSQQKAIESSPIVAQKFFA
jgi:Protein of unknown function (DUF4058)